MKNVYEVLNISIVSFDEDIITTSTGTVAVQGTFDGEEHQFSGDFI